MSAMDKEASQFARYSSLDELTPAPPLSSAVKAMSDHDVDQRAAADPDMGTIPVDFWDTAHLVKLVSANSKSLA
jgi:hypothetical protein